MKKGYMTIQGIMILSMVSLLSLTGCSGKDESNVNSDRNSKKQALLLSKPNDPVTIFREEYLSGPPIVDNNNSSSFSQVFDLGLPQINPLNIKGDLMFVGSSTVYPLIDVLYQRFVTEGYSGIVQSETMGTTMGLSLLCKKGNVDIVGASRPINEVEKESCLKNRVNPIAFQIGSDAVVIVVHKDNDFLNQVTLEELAKIFTVDKWSEVNPKYPDKPIEKFVPDSGSGTLDFFMEKVITPLNYKSINFANTQRSVDDDELVQGVILNHYAVSFFGYSYYQKHAKDLKLIPVEGVIPNNATVETGQYPLSRPLLLYVDRQRLQSSPTISAFLSFYFSHANEEIQAIGYFPLSATLLEQGKQTFLNNHQP